MNEPKRILIVGGGYIGMYAALGLRGLARRSHRITVVNPENFMQYQPFLSEVAAGTIEPRAVVVPLRPVLRHAEPLVGEVQRIDHANRTAYLRLVDDRATDLGYDVVVLGPGSRSRVLPIRGSPITESASRPFEKRSTCATGRSHGWTSRPRQRYGPASRRAHVRVRGRRPCGRRGPW